MIVSDTTYNPTGRGASSYPFRRERVRIRVDPAVPRHQLLEQLPSGDRRFFSDDDERSELNAGDIVTAEGQALLHVSAYVCGEIRER